MTKAVRKAIMKRSELENKYVKIRQMKTCSKLYKKERKKIDETLDLKEFV